MSKKFKNYKYIVDTKLVAYYLFQRGSPIFGILDKIASMVFQHPKGEIYFAFDIGKSSFRSKIHPEYKGHRTKRTSTMTDEDIKRLETFNDDYIRLSELCRLLPIRVLAVHGVEADDLASIMAYRFQQDPDTFTYLITADMDYINSVVGNDNVAILDVFNGTLIDNNEVLKRYKLTSRRQFNVHKAIFGDVSDNIKFIQGVGSVKAAEIFENIYDIYDDPSSEDMAKIIEQYMKQRPKLKLHPYHINQGRTKVIDALNANLSIVDTFTDTDLMSDHQKTQFSDCLNYTIPTTISSMDFLKQSLDIVGYPVVVGHKAGKVFRITE